MPRPQRKEEILRSEVPPVLPLMALRSTIVYPLGTIAVQMGAPENLSLLRAHEEPGVIVALVVALGDHDEPIDSTKFTGKVGVAARVHERINLPGDTVQITLQGLRRITIDGIDQLNPYPIARVAPARETPPDDADLDDLVARVTTAAETLANLVDRIPDEVPAILKMNVSDPGRFADLAATNMNFRIADKDEVLQKLDVGERLRFILSRLEREVARARVMEDVKKQTEIKIEQHQREFYLRQQLRAIQSELGETDPGEKEAVDLLRKVDDAKLPEKVAQEARREVERLRMLSPASSEYQVVRTYLDWVLSLPWNARSGEQDRDIDLRRVEDALSERHYGLDEAKDRIVEYLAVRKLRAMPPAPPATDGDAPPAAEAAPPVVPDPADAAIVDPPSPSETRQQEVALAGPILCFAGPPGTGKTSLGEVIAKAIGRQFYRISVGGVRDEAEIRGHRRTYVGSMPGLLIQALRRVGVRDPVFLIDEIDKMSGGGPSGDPTAAMLEVLDPSQNQTFVDHYLNLPFDLSQVLFICTANNVFDIPGPLRDRMEIIRIAGYTIEEKVEIAWRYTIPKLLEEHGITEQDIVFTDEVLSFVAARYSREAGLRNFSRNLATLMRKRARRKADGEQGAWVLDREKVEEVLGPPRYAVEEAEKEPEVGAVTGLAWTSTGGDLMVIEALRMPGTGRLTVTGQLGDVMRESVDAAHSYVRSRAETLGIEAKEFKEADIHIHFPAGAIPKDGPSAGIAITLALASVLSRRPVRRDVAMTGEVTLRGKVLEIGGVKEKVLAAYRAGLREVILPKTNEKDLRDVPKEVREHMAFSHVASMDEVLRIALLPSPVANADRAPDAGADEKSTAPLADATELAVGEHHRTPGAREEAVPLADVNR
ncbi:endopeptidase La [Roseisolibacter sp. H3M3-2]|uniref:endopeptidase La n=1 Tax=Roseisolibacter sp. H3M3-2 TaxID=3031323 RepID=UPI0023DA9065|nr:endopeptidase La [Roseisolibacter sp. H3M3-2]MDF1501898.1 endopeptidase La [Roseisolibacter sp. H3M3-2]